MSPEQVTIMTNLLSIMKVLSGWPFAMFFFLLIVGPWILSLSLAYSSRKRFEGVVSMYEQNVQLVENYESVASDLKDVVMVNTQTFSTLTKAIETNQFCPIVREKGGTQ